MNPPRRPVLNLSDRRVDLDQHLVFPEVGAVVELSPLEVSLLEFLAARGGEAVERDVLLTEVWGYAPSVQSRAIDKTVHRLRTKLEFDPSDPQHLQGVRGLGYRLVGVTVSADEARRPTAPDRG